MLREQVLNTIPLLEHQIKNLKRELANEYICIAAKTPIDPMGYSRKRAHLADLEMDLNILKELVK